MSPVVARKLLAVHRWSSIIVSANFILFALTGLVLVFHDEIDVATGVTPELREGEHAPVEQLPLAQALQIAQKANPGLHPLFASQRKEIPNTVLFGFAAGEEAVRPSKMLAVDRREAKILPKVDISGSFTFFVLRLHAEFLAGPPGRLVLGVVGLAILVSIVTGIFVYGPTMKRFSFGLLRRDRSGRALLADLHKLLGAATFAWQFLVALTGVILCFGVVMFQGFARSEIKSLATPYADVPAVTDFTTIDAAAASAEAAEPTRHWRSILFPGSSLATKHHFTVLLEGGEGLESHMLGVVVADAVQPSDVTVLKLPLYLKAMLVSEPLHFGNYGGLTLKLLWTLFTLISLALSVSGVWVFLISRRAKQRKSVRSGARVKATEATETTGEEPAAV